MLFIGSDAPSEGRLVNIAVTIWNQRAVPVFDVARDILLVDVVPGQWGEAQKEPLAGELPVQKALRLAEPGDDRLICGAISRPVLAMVRG